MRFSCFFAASNKVTAPTVLLLTKGHGSAMLLSTWVSAAMLTIISVWFTRFLMSFLSAMSPFTSLYLLSASMSFRFAGLEPIESLSRFVILRLLYLLSM